MCERLIKNFTIECLTTQGQTSLLPSVSLDGWEKRWPRISALVTFLCERGNSRSPGMKDIHWVHQWFIHFDWAEDWLQRLSPRFSSTNTGRSPVSRRLMLDAAIMEHYPSLACNLFLLGKATVHRRLGMFCPVLCQVNRSKTESLGVIKGGQTCLFSFMAWYPSLIDSARVGSDLNLI